LNRLNAKEPLTLILSSLALATSLAALYFQFFHVSESITAAKLALDMTAGESSGSVSLDIALINSGNRDALILGCSLKSENVTFTLELQNDSHAILKPYEIKPISLRGSYKVNDMAANAEKPILLNCRIVGARGYDVESAQRIGSIIIVEHKIIGIDLLKFPVELNK
jgi:hypothetical protein